VDTIRGLDEELKELVVAQKVLRSVPNIFNANISFIEEMINLNTLTSDQLLGTFTAYEMIISNEISTIKALALKKDNNPKEEHSDPCCESNEEEFN